MPLTIRARITDAQGAPRANITVRAHRFDPAGTPIALGNATTAADGSASIASAWGFTADYQPRLALQVTAGRDPAVTLKAAPVSFANSICEFGVIVFDPAGEQALRDAPLRLAALEAEYSAERATRDGQIAALTTQLEQAQAQAQAQAQVQAELEAQLQAQLEAQARVSVAASAVAPAEGDGAAAMSPAPAARPVETSIQRLVQGTAEQLQQTQRALATQHGGYQLGSVSLELKVMPGAAEGDVSLPGAREAGAIEAAALSTLKVDFHPAPTGPAGAAHTVPPLAGYTEALARRKLAERRLRAEVVAQFVADDAAVGRVALQSPAAGTAIAEGSVVVIGIGRKG